MAFYIGKRRFGDSLAEDTDSGMAKASIGMLVLVAFGAAWLWLSGKKKG